MAITTATVGNDGQLILPAEVQRTLGIAPGSRVEIVVRGHQIEILPKERLPIDQQAARQAARELRGMYAGQPSLEDEYFRDRDRDTW